MARESRANLVPGASEHYTYSLLRKIASSLATLASGKNADGTDFSLLTVSGTLTPRGYEQITSLGTAQALSVPAGANLALIQAQGQAVRYRDDGVGPTATVGMPIAAAGSLSYNGDLAALRFIEQAAGAVLNVLYYQA